MRDVVREAINFCCFQLIITSTERKKNAHIEAANGLDSSGMFLLGCSPRDS